MPNRVSIDGEDVLDYLARKDKWYVSGGRVTVWAPPFPLWPDWPGFWDEAHFADIPLPRPFTVFALDESGRHLPLRHTARRWRPSELTQEYTGPGIEVREARAITTTRSSSRGQRPGDGTWSDHTFYIGTSNERRTTTPLGRLYAG